MNKSKVLAVCVLVLTLTACGVLSAIAQWAPVGAAAVNAVVSIVAKPAQSAKLQADVTAIDKTFFDLAADANAAQASGSTTTVAGDLGVILADAPGIASDISPLVPASDMQYVNDALAVIEVTLTAYQAAVGGPPPAPAAKNFGCAGYQEYGDGSFHVWADCANGVDAVDVATGGAAKVANPKAKPAKIGSFKRQFNAVAVVYGHPDKQLKLSLLEKLHVK